MNLISVVIRTHNESRYLGELLDGIKRQRLDGCSVEVVVVDSGSTDETLSIAESHGCRITHIAKADFTFGRSLNIGCEFARGDILAFVSGHCIPVNNLWLSTLARPIIEKRCEYVYGRQLGRDYTKFSESRVFQKYFPNGSMIPQQGYFVNNANAAIARSSWEKYRFDEVLTGLEDMFLAKQIVSHEGRVGYVADAAVYHIHDEQWSQIMNRFEREAVALAEIMPEAVMGKRDLVVCYARSVIKDIYAAFNANVLRSNLIPIFLYRACQYWGSYRGASLARKIARLKTKSYFYPDIHFERPKKADYESSGSASNETSQ